MVKVTKVKKRTTPDEEDGRSGILGRLKAVEFDEDTGIKLCLYGRPATGKTSLWSTFPRPIVTAVCSGGNAPGELRSLGMEARKGVQAAPLKEARDLLDLVAYVEEEGIKTFVIDHLTGVEDLILKELLGLDEIPRQRSWGLATRETYGQRAVMCKDLAFRILSLKCNVVLVCQEKVFEVEGAGDTIKPSVGPALGGSFGEWLFPACDYTVQTFKARKTKKVREKKQTKKGIQVIEKEVETDGIDYCVRTGPDVTYLTKFRVPIGTPLPDRLIVTNRTDTYERMMKLINGETES